MTARRVLRAIAIAFLVAASAAAHSRPLSYSFWTATSVGVDVAVQLTRADLALLGFNLDTEPSREADAARRVQSLVAMRVGGQPCRLLAAPERVPSVFPWVVFRFSLTCRQIGERIVSTELGPLLESGGRHLVRWDDGRSRPVDVMLDAEHPSAPLGDSRHVGARVLDYFAAGAEHLLSGWDHMVFVLALLLLAQRAREVVALVTSFTVAHSVTLCLAVLHIVRPDPRPVEALIGFSIALLGAENAWLLSERGPRIPAFIVAVLALSLLVRDAALSKVALAGLATFSVCHFALLRRSVRPTRLRVAIAFAFGLIHGFGFAGAMAELNLPTVRLVPALLGFNLGVEAGQLGIVIVGWPILRALERAKAVRVHLVTTEALSAAVCAIGLFWYTTRLCQ